MPTAGPTLLHGAIRQDPWRTYWTTRRCCCPTYGQVLADQITGAEAAAIDAGEAESARTELF